ncbi:hypothetical protein BJX68DRAFT_169046 [Aspergillus pseudodeflectus]|uniref:Uncharacterized protein n=1 Tax=Aspergillus pseudodeflectus TaxID=176178 RepID=A0ABR4JP19_9EURO
MVASMSLAVVFYVHETNHPHERAGIVLEAARRKLVNVCRGWRALRRDRSAAHASLILIPSGVVVISLLPGASTYGHRQQSIQGPLDRMSLGSSAREPKAATKVCLKQYLAYVLVNF